MINWTQTKIIHVKDQEIFPYQIKMCLILNKLKKITHIFNEKENQYGILLFHHWNHTLWLNSTRQQCCFLLSIKKLTKINSIWDHSNLKTILLKHPLQYNTYYPAYSKRFIIWRDKEHKNLKVSGDLDFGLEIFRRFV